MANYVGLKAIMMKNKLYIFLTLYFSSCFVMAEDEVNVRLIGTSDLHSYISNFDYYKNSNTDKYGLVNLIAEIEKYRSEVKNTVLADTGDLLVGNPLGDYLATNFEPDSDNNAPLMCVLNTLNYSIAAPGNHDFDYGLEYLHFNYDKGQFPTVLSNVYHYGSDKPYFKPYVIVPQKVQSESGKFYTLNVGYIGIVPTQTMDLNSKWLKGRIDIVDPLPEAKRWSKVAKENGADIVVALAHSGMKDVAYIEGMEDMAWHLSKVGDVDAMLFGHTHKPFPSKKYAKTKNVDIKKGTVNGIPAAQPGKWGDHIGIVDLELLYDNGWQIKDGSAFVVSNKELKESKEQVFNVNRCIEEQHDKIVEAFNKRVGTVDVDITNDFNLLANDSVYQIVSDSQYQYAINHIDSELPILSSSPVATHRNDPAHYVAISKGDVNMRDVGAMVYSSTLAAKEITGEEVKEWLEISASMYSEPNSSSNNIIKSDHLTFLYYTIPNLEYKIDITQPSIFNSFGNKVADGEGRIKEIRYNGKAVEPSDKFIIIASSYSPFFANRMKAGQLFIDIGHPNSREVLRDYLSTMNGVEKKTEVSNNWLLLLDENKVYRYTASNSAENIDSFREFSGLDITLDKVDGNTNTYIIKP